MAEKKGDLSTPRILVKLILFTLLVPGGVTIWLPLFVLFPQIRLRPVAWNLPTFGAIALIAIGAAGYLWCALDFAFFGKGTPAPIDMPKYLVMRGPYKYTRNPMYISVCTLLLGESGLFRSTTLVGYAAVVAICFHLFVLLEEEPTLRRKMGAAYETYSSEVPRWIPRFKPRGPHHAL